MTVVAFIPARAGSTRIPNKNLATVGDEALVSRALRCAWDAGCDRVVVSTNSAEIGVRMITDAVARAAETNRPRLAEYHSRPEALAGPHAQIEDAIAHWLRRDSLSPDDVIVLLQPTSPFRKPETVRRCVDLVRGGCDSALAVTVDNHRAFFWGRLRALYDEASGTDLAERVVWDRPLASRPRTQDLQPVAIETGSVYAFTAAHFRATGCRMGGREAIVRVPWLEALDIDTPEDLELARYLAPLADGRRAS